MAVGGRDDVWRHFGVTTQSVYTLIDADATVVSEGYLDDDELRAGAAEIAG